LLCCSLATLLYFARSRFALVVERELRCSAEQRRPTRKLNEVQAGDIEHVFSCAPAILTPSPRRTCAARVNGESRLAARTAAPADAQVERRFQMQAENVKHVFSGAPTILTRQGSARVPRA
jgi:hypothetical protein